MHDVEYENAQDNAGGTAGFGRDIPLDRSKLAKGWYCLSCYRVYSPSITECEHCNELPQSEREQIMKDTHEH